MCMTFGCNPQNNLCSFLRSFNLVILDAMNLEICCFQMGLVLRRFANNKGADQHVNPRSLISAFVIHCLESTISKLTTSEISNF